MLSAGFKGAWEMLIGGDPVLYDIIFLTLKVSSLATMIALLIGLPLGVYLGLRSFPGRKFVVSVVNTLMGLPPVVAGLIVWMALSRYGPLGFLEIIYTPTAIVIAQVIIATPVVTGLTLAAIQQIDVRFQEQIRALGANQLQFLWVLVKEARYSLLAAVIAGFGAAISEVGAAMMVGGNIFGQTRVLTTAVVLEVSRGNYEVALALSFVLVFITYLITAALTSLQQKQYKWS